MNRLLFCGLFIAAGSYCRAGVILSITPPSQIVALGSQASFAIDISGLGSGIALGTYDINLGFDPSQLLYADIVYGNQVDISGLGDIQSLTPGTGTVEVFELSLDSAAELNSFQSPSFTLVVLTFNTLATGTDSPLTLSVNALGDAYGNSISATIDNATLSVGAGTATPEPKPELLLLVALPLIAGSTVRRNRLPAQG